MNHPPARALASYALFTMALALLVGCHDASDAGEAGAELASTAGARLEAVLARYEALRAGLAADAVADVAARADALARASSRATADAPPRLRPHLTELEAAARRLEATSKDDDDALRRAFGEVSEPLVELLSDEANLRADRHLFECPMAQGYRRWVQPTETISNPYMGGRMPSCGNEVDW